MLPTDFEFNFDTLSALSRPFPHYPWQWRYILRFIFKFDIIRLAVSRAATNIFAHELQRRLDSSGSQILSLAVHPGEVATEGVSKSNGPVLATIARFVFATPDQGAANPLWAATAEEARTDSAKYRGKLILPVGKVGSAHPVTQNERQVNNLWEVATNEVNKQLAASDLPLLQAWA